MTDIPLLPSNLHAEAAVIGRKDNRIQRTCEQCNGLFMARPDKVKKGLARFCSNTCSGKAKRRPLADRLWEKVDKSGDCWIWTGARSQDGYGCIAVSDHRGDHRPAHRVVFEMTYGPVPDGMEVCHRCDNPPCVRPEHLFVGTHQDNMADCSAKGRNRGSTSQPHGEKNHNAKLTEQQVVEIRDRYTRGGISQRALAMEYGISQGQASDVINHKRWRWL
jgi:hypothetical protein